MSNGKLDSPNLDDRKWQDIVDEAKALIPKYAPEWTDHNPSDLGITLIELFAWIVEGMIYRLNRVPEKNYIEFLNLLGITRDPATPASTYLTYRLAPGTASTTVRKGSLVATQQTEKEEGIVFETDEELKVLPINLVTALFIKKVENATTYQNVTTNLVNSPLSGMTLNIPGSDSVMIILGFDSSSTEAISLPLSFDKSVKRDLEGIPIEISWLFSANNTDGPLPPEFWTEMRADTEGTNMFQKNGKVSFNIPDKWTSQKPSDWRLPPPQPVLDKINQSLFWIGLKISNPRSKELNLALRHILFNSVSATNAITITQPELLGVSKGKRFQSFALKNRPLYKKPGARNPYDHLKIQVREPQVGGGFGPWVPWKLSDDLNKGPDKSFLLNPVTGTISFGDYDPATSPEGHGTIPSLGSEIRAEEYRYVVGGVKSNVPSDTINSLRTPIPNIISVTNPGAAKGGLDEEDFEETKRRGPELLRNRYRAITVEDYEYLAREATTAVKKVRCLPPRLFTQSENIPFSQVVSARANISNASNDQIQLANSADAAKFKKGDIISIIRTTGAKERKKINEIQDAIISLVGSLSSPFAGGEIRIDDLLPGQTTFRVDSIPELKRGHNIIIEQGPTSENGTIREITDNFITLFDGLTHTYSMTGGPINIHYLNIGDPWTFGGLNRDTGYINLIIIQDAPLSEPTPEPPDELLQEVSDYLDERRILTSKLLVTYPRYLPIKVTVKINVFQKAVSDRLIPDTNTFKNDIKTKIKEFLHPVLGGPDKKGWEIGQDITISSLFDYIKPSPDIGFISSIELSAELPKYKPPNRPPDVLIDPPPKVWVKLADYEIICSADEHDVIPNVI